jgi:hypothetical protein
MAIIDEKEELRRESRNASMRKYRAKEEVKQKRKLKYYLKYTNTPEDYLEKRCKTYEEKMKFLLPLAKLVRHREKCFNIEKIIPNFHSACVVSKIEPDPEIDYIEILK